jgi:hypothetical protein
MARVHNRTRKTKPSQKSKLRRREFLKRQKMTARREYVRKEKEAKETTDFYQKELKDRDSIIEGYRQSLIDERKNKTREIKRRIDANNIEWGKKLDERDEKVNRLWLRKEREIREEEWVIREGEKQEFMAVQGRMVYDLGKVRQERDELEGKVQGLEEENDELKKKVKGLEEEIEALKGRFLGFRG